MPQDVIVYTAEGCSACEAVKQFLNKENVPFQERNITRNPAFATELEKKLGRRATPLTVINGQTILGFDQPAFRRALENSLLGTRERET